MRTLRRMVSDRALVLYLALLVTISAASYGTAAPAPVEPEGCRTNTCKDIQYVFDCSAFGPIHTKWEHPDCIYCTTNSGRCQSGAANDGGGDLPGICEKFVGNPQRFAIAEVTEVCFCNKLAGGVPAPKVEGSSAGLVGNYTALGSDKYICPG